MSSGGFYSRLAALTPEQRAIFARRLAVNGLADPDAEIAPRPPGADPVPASLVQQRLWLLDQMEPGNPFYNLPLLGFRLTGPLGCREQGAFAAACSELARRHEALRTTFGAVDGAPVQIVAPPPPPSAVPLADLSGLPTDRRSAAARGLALEEARRPFDLAAGPLWRTRLLRLDAGDHLLLVAMHHIISDAWSIGVFYRELRALYAAARARHPSPLPALPVQYPDFALWQRRRLTGDLLEGEIAFWRAQLAGAPEQLELPTDRPRPRARTYRGRRRTLALSRDLPEALAGLAQAAGASLFMAVLAGLDALLHRLTGADDLVLGSPVAGRGQAGTEGLIGFFVNTVVFRVRLASELSLTELLARVREVVLDVYEHQELPFDRLVEEIRPRRSTSYGPVFQAMFSLQNISTPDLALDGLEVAPEWIDNGTAQTDLILFGGSQGGRLNVLQLEYNTDLFDDATIARMEGHLLTLMAAAAAAPATRLADLPLLSPPERHQLVEWSGALPPATARVEDRKDGDRGDRLERRFAAQAARRPAAVAVEVGSASLSYGELARRAAHLAGRLARFGVGPEVPVGLCLERTLDLPVAMLGALMAGGAYLPLDPESPAERLSFILDDARAPVVVTTRRLASRLGDTTARLVLLDEADAPEGLAAGRPLPASGEQGTGPEALAYVIYTSGSTGRPKGVLVSHRAALRLFAATADLFGFGPGDAWTVFHSPAFDFAVWEIWGALLHGGRAVLLPAGVTRSPEELLALLRERRVTFLSQTPSAFRGLLAAMIADPAAPRDLALRAIVFGGETLQPEDLRAWFAHCADAAALTVNMYGITETTVHATFRSITAADLERPGGPASPIGRPLADLALHLLDRAGNPLPIGVVGEICVGGAGVARGYLARPDLTAERFVPDPFSGARGARLYRSGDLARRWPDGDVEYIGRIDLQVKVRGVRIELGEIEAALARHPAIAAAAVAARELAPGEAGLAAYCVPCADGRLPEPAELRAFLRGILPEVMVPGAFVPLASLPLTVNGKLDRRALPAPERLRQAGEEYLPPSTPLEETLAAVWCDLLGVDRVGMRDDFFDLGGHSLLATRLASRLRDRLGLEVSAQLVFHTPTVTGMAGELERLIAAGAREAAAGTFVPHAPALVRVARRARRSAG